MILNKVAACAVACVLASMIYTQPSYSQPINGLELVNNAKQMDGKTVMYRGEVVGDIMVRGNHAWIHLNDGVIAIGVWVKKEDLKEIGYLGGYRTKGDVIEVTGILHRNCSEHGGDFDIHAISVSRITRGEHVPADREDGKKNSALILSMIVLFAFLLPRIPPFLRTRA